ELVIAGQVAVGELAPDFELDSSLGRPVRLSSLRGDWVLLVFAERKESLRALADTLGDLHTIGVRLVGVCDEKPRTIESFAAKQHASFLLLADVTGEVSALYGVWDRIHTMSVPGFVLIDRHGRVHIALLGQVLPAADLARLVREVSGQL
ncbi:MAG: redoxin domain-containing protein, partial [Candidatus Eisenbacteria bacterium]|nr:redoxin domain-containing protein [Candidatus Eisenbacteria bacterium]